MTYWDDDGDSDISRKDAGTLLGGLKGHVIWKAF